MNEIYNFFVPILVTLLILLVIYNEKYPTGRSRSIVKGNQGEKIVRKILHSFDKAVFIQNDLLLMFGNRSAQIDHVCLTKKALYVIETKNYSGTLVYNEEDIYWTQQYKNFKCPVYSPIIQNAGHIKNIRKLSTSLKEIKIFNIVVFAGKCYLEGPNISSSNYMVPASELLNLLYKLDDELDNVIPKFVCKDVITKILLANKSNSSNNKKHINKVKRIVRY